MGLFTSVRGRALANIVLPLGDALLGHPMIHRFRWLERAQWWPRTQIEAERRRALIGVIQTAYHEVPFYREVFDKAGVKPESIRDSSDLVRLPVVTKSMLTEGYPGKTCRPVRGRTYESRTSGSTGTNFAVREDHETAGWYRATFLLALHWAGWAIGEPHVQIGMTTTRNMERRLKDFAMGCHYFSGYDLSDAALDACLEFMDSKKIRHLWGYPGSLHCLAVRAKQRGCNRELRSVVTWGDQLHLHWRSAIETAFGTKVHDTYGCGEGMHIAAQCGQGHHYHLHDLDVVVEFLDEEGQPVVAGRPGNVVVTRLHAGPMPLIRYSIGDRAIAPDGSVCACGRNFTIIKEICGRTGDYVLTPTGNRLIVHFFTGILEYFNEVKAFQAIQAEWGKLCLRVVPGPGYSGKTGEAICQALRAKGADLEIHVEPVSDIPLTSGGKRKFIVRTLGPNETGIVDQDETSIETKARIA